jgi:hypothetical protein
MSNQTYQVQYSPDLTYWLDISGNLPSSGTTTGFTNGTLLPHPHQGFLRVAVQ